MKVRRSHAVAIIMGCVIVAAVGNAPLARSQQARGGEISDSAAPLMDAADLLQQRYGRPVAYEDPIVRSRGDLNSFGLNKSGVEVLRLKSLGLVMPAGLTRDTEPVLGLAELNRVIDAYKQQNPERPRFRAIESGPWLEIVPSEVRDEAGNFKPVGSPLDRLISVPTGHRSPSGHLDALCQAATAAGGRPLLTSVHDGHVGPLDGYFVANRYTLRGSRRPITEPLNDDDELPYIRFDWGTGPMTARMALEDLLARSGSTLTWRLICPVMPDAPAPYGDACGLNVGPVYVTPVRGALRALYLDRCPDCRPVPVLHEMPRGR